MQISIMDGIEILIISMVVVFLILTILMYFLKLIAWFFMRKEPVQQPEPVRKTAVQSNKTLFEEDEDAQAAALIALIEANNNQQDRHYEIAEIKQIN